MLKYKNEDLETRITNSPNEEVQIAFAIVQRLNSEEAEMVVKSLSPQQKHVTKEAILVYEDIINSRIADALDHFGKNIYTSTIANMISDLYPNQIISHPLSCGKTIKFLEEVRN